MCYFSKQDAIFDLLGELSTPTAPSSPVSRRKTPRYETSSEGSSDSFSTHSSSQNTFLPFENTRIAKGGGRGRASSEEYERRQRARVTTTATTTTTTRRCGIRPRLRSYEYFLTDFCPVQNHDDSREMGRET